jgi:hypothetical protein
VAFASLILGIIGTVTGVGALAWQVIAWTRSGPVVTLTTTTSRSRREDMIVTAVNSGRGPVSVMRLEIRGIDISRFDLKLTKDSEQLPFRLEPSASVSWQLDLSKFVGEETQSRESAREWQAAMKSPDRDMRVYAILGNGKTVRSGPISREIRWEVRPRSGR